MPGVGGIPSMGCMNALLMPGPSRRAHRSPSRRSFADATRVDARRRLDGAVRRVGVVRRRARVLRVRVAPLAPALLSTLLLPAGLLGAALALGAPVAFVVAVALLAVGAVGACLPSLSRRPRPRRRSGHGAGPRPRPSGTSADDDPPLWCRQRARYVTAVVQGDAGGLGHMGSWRGTRTWFSRDGRCAVAYRPVHGVAVTVSDPACPAGLVGRTVREFAAFCHRRGLVPAFTSVQARHRATFESLGWCVVDVAQESVLDLTTFSLRGRRRTDLRTAVNRAAREGVRAEWTTFAELAPDLRRQVEELSRTWLADKELPELGFTLGGLREMDDPAVRLLVALDGDGRLHGVTSWLPVHRAGVLVGRTLDVMWRGPGSMPGVVEFLVARAALSFAEEGLETLSLSGTPLAGVAVGRRPDGPARSASLCARAARTLLEPVYGFSSLARFKDKFGPEHRPLLLACPRGVQLPGVARALVGAYAPTLRWRDVASLAARGCRRRATSVWSGAVGTAR